MTIRKDAGDTLPPAERIPDFDSEDAEREWWATHDTSQLPGQDVELRYAGAPALRERAVTVQVDEHTVARLRELAAQRGVEYHAMVRAWIMDRLRRESPAV